VNEHPILFSGPMVRAILEGRKTMTRRVVSLPDWFCEEYAAHGASEIASEMDCPYGAPGDRLWVRETWASFGSSASITPPVSLRCQIRYDADNSCQWRDVPEGAKGVRHNASFRLRPSIHMPRWASRLTLEIAAVRVERLQEISRMDALAESCVGSGFDDETPQSEFAELWDSINAARGFGWSVNPWVWVVSFKRVEVPS